jgi:hypothetical protein
MVVKIPQDIGKQNHSWRPHFSFFSAAVAVCLVSTATAFGNCSSDAYEPDNECPPGVFISNPEIRLHNFCDGPYDIAGFNALAGNCYEILTANEGPLADVWVEIYVPDCWPLLASGRSIVWTAPYSGTFTLVAYQRDWTSGPDREYTLSFTETACGECVATEIEVAAYDNWVPQTHNGQVTWIGTGGNGNPQIFFWDSSTGVTTQVTSHGAYVEISSPRIHNGQITWARDGDIFFWVSATGITTQITNNASDNRHPQTHNGQVVWGGWNGISRAIFFWDSSTEGTVQVSADADDGARPQIHNGQVVWYSTWPYKMFFWDSATDITTQVTNGETFINSPQIHNGQAVWQGHDGTSNKIFFWDSATDIVTQVPSDAESNYAPQIHNGKVTWYGWDVSSYEIFFWDSSTGTTTQVTGDYSDDYYPQIHDGQVTWYGYDESDYSQIFLWDSLTDIKIQITNNAAWNRNPQIHNGQVTWWAYSEIDYGRVFFRSCPEESGNEVIPGSAGWDENGALIWQGNGGTFHVFRGYVGELPNHAGYCVASVEETSWIDSETPWPGETWFYLVAGASAPSNLGMSWPEGQPRVPASFSCP